MPNKPDTPNNDTTLEEYEDFLDELYDKCVTIEFNGHKVNIPFDAVICNELINLMNTMIEEY